MSDDGEHMVMMLRKMLWVVCLAGLAGLVVYTGLVILFMLWIERMIR